MINRMKSYTINLSSKDFYVIYNNPLEFGSLKNPHSHVFSHQYLLNKSYF
jgi:hypothetical protein